MARHKMSRKHGKTPRRHSKARKNRARRGGRVYQSLDQGRMDMITAS